MSDNRLSLKKPNGGMSTTRISMVPNQTINDLYTNNQFSKDGSSGNLAAIRKQSKLNLNLSLEQSHLQPPKDTHALLKGVINGNYLDELKSQRYSRGKKSGTGLLVQRYQPKARANDFSVFDIENRLNQYKRQHGKQILGREDLMTFAVEYFGVPMSKMAATDAILYCRGPQLDTSPNYDEKKLVQWLLNNLQAMKKMDFRAKPASVRADNSKSKRSLNISVENKPTYFQKMVGQSRYMQKSQRVVEVESEESYQDSQQLREAHTRELHDQIDVCLRQCEKLPSLRRKMQQTLQEMEETMAVERARKGMEAQKGAQMRIRDSLRKKEEEKEASIEKMLEQTAKYDSPIKAANLSGILREQWTEKQDSYLVVSQLKAKDKVKLNNMIFNRYNAW